VKQSKFTQQEATFQNSNFFKKKILDEDSTQQYPNTCIHPTEALEERLIPTITPFLIFTTKYKGFIYSQNLR